MEHELKIWPQYFCRVVDGSKTFEIRKNDRGFQPGDTVKLMEYDPTEYIKDTLTTDGSYTWKAERGFTGKELYFKIGYVLPIDAETVVFSLLPHQENREKE